VSIPMVIMFIGKDVPYPVLVSFLQVRCPRLCEKRRTENKNSAILNIRKIPTAKSLYLTKTDFWGGGKSISSSLLGEKALFDSSRG
jgi:hypothetical protein